MGEGCAFALVVIRSQLSCSQGHGRIDRRNDNDLVEQWSQSFP